MSHFIIFDTEYTTWEGAQDRNWTGKNEYREVVQIGAIKIRRDDFSVIDELNVLIRPKRNPVLSDFFITLTNISQEDVDRTGISFIDAYHRFIDFCGKDLVLSYGGDDRILAENRGLEYGTSNPFRKSSASYMDIRYFILRADPGAAPYVSGELWKYFNLPKPHEKNEHDALFDCYSILAAMRHLTSLGIKFPFLKIFFALKPVSAINSSR